MKTVIFDIGNVLVRWSPQTILRRFSNDEAVRQRYADVIFNQCWLALDAGLLDYQAAIRFYALLLEQPEAEIERFMQVVRESLEPLPLGENLLRDLHQRGIDLICISNMPYHSDAWLREHYDYWPLFRGRVISAEVRLIKPSAAIYQYALDTYGLNPENCLFVDDVPANIEAAARLGIRGVCYENNQASVEAVYRFLES